MAQELNVLHRGKLIYEETEFNIFIRKEELENQVRMSGKPPGLIAARKRRCSS